ncbi:MAG: amidase family protein [Methylotetracoccus sp.]|nr:amidase family protein [Methylotetracoccus sp.]
MAICAFVLTAALPAAAVETPSCAARISAVMVDIAARDLDTSRGPPLNAFLALNPFAVGKAEMLDRATARGKPRGALQCMPVAVKDNFATFDMPMAVGSPSLAGNQPPRSALYA